MPMDLSDDFMLIKQCDPFLTYDFYISKYPIVLSPADSQPKLATPTDGTLYRTTWVEAARFCNQLSVRENLQAAHDPETGLFITNPLTMGADTPSGFRLPTPQEWDYAAKGWSGSRRGGYCALQKEQFKVPHLDYPTTPEQARAYESGYSTVQELIPNILGIYGMVVYAKEWCASPYGYPSDANLLAFWEEYYINYDVISHQTTTRVCTGNDRFPFRVVLPFIPN